MTDVTADYKRAMENEIVMLNAIIEWISDALDGKPVSDFAESFPVVYRARAAAFQAAGVPDLIHRMLAYRKALLTANRRRREKAAQ